MRTLVFTFLVTPLLVMALLANAADVQYGPAENESQVEPDDYYPLSFLSLKAYEQAFPGTPVDRAFLEASTAKYGRFSDIRFRGQGRGKVGIWNTLGPETVETGAGFSIPFNVAGRVTALAISPTCQLRGQCRLWAGTAGGGVWRSDHAMHTNDVGWQWIGDGLGTNSIGSLALDPNDRSGDTIFVGTGETNSPNTSGAGTGLYRSTNGGDTWTRIPTMFVDATFGAIDFTVTRGIGAVVIVPGDSQTIYVATTSAMLGMTGVRGGQTVTTGFPQAPVGLYKTENGGASWSLEWEPPVDANIPDNPDGTIGASDAMYGVRDVKLDPRDPNTVYVTAFNNAVHRSAPALEGGDASFKPIFNIVFGAGFRDLAMFDVTVDTHTRLYVYNGTEERYWQRLYRLDNADRPAATIVNQPGDFGDWIELSRPFGEPGASHASWSSWRMCSVQCFYDLVVAVPDGQPDTVIIGGVSLPGFGSPTIRSTDEGVSFRRFGRDGQVPSNRSHVDVHAVVFHPANPDIAFVGSDGGVVRNDGTFVDNSDICTNDTCRLILSYVPTRLYFLNKGLQTLQFYNVSVDPKAPLRRLMGGLQDNSTIWHDGTESAKVWKTLFPVGDGTPASGFHPTRPEVLFASFQSSTFVTNFRNGELPPDGDIRRYWVRTAEPIQFSGERTRMTASSGRQFITFDYVNPDTQFTGYQHVWRTQNNGGDQAFLEANCGYPSGGRNPDCGDWVPLGIAYDPHNPGDPNDPSHWPGDLTSEYYGSDRTRGLIIAAERSPRNAGTLWAATNKGRLFISENADGAGPLVTFLRLDSQSTPNRFISRIFADPENEYVAYVSYSGFNALTPGTPGHVFKVTYDPNTMTATFESLDYDLGDIPINTIAYDYLTGDLYAATDFGPLMLPGGSSSWELAGVGFPESMIVDLEIVPDERLLVAATHGLGIFYANLPKAE